MLSLWNESHCNAIGYQNWLLCNQLRYRVTHLTDIISNQEILAEPTTADNINIIPNSPRKKSTTSTLYLSKETKCKSSGKDFEMIF